MDNIIKEQIRKALNEGGYNNNDFFDDVIMDIIRTGRRYGQGTSFEKTENIITELVIKIHNDAIQLAADNAETKDDDSGSYDSDCNCSIWVLDKDSILNLKR